MNIDEFHFWTAHQAVSEYLFEQSKGIPFEDFEHPVLMDEEISYKRETLRKARKILRTWEWHDLAAKPGRILSRLWEACTPSVSSNLISHRWGPIAALSVDQPRDQVTALERHFLRLFGTAASSRADFGGAFDGLAGYLREKKLGCQWAPMTYFAFLANERLYFSFLPSRADFLLSHYGIDKPFSGHVCWKRYQTLLDLADELRHRLLAFRPGSMIDIQSYMFVAAFELSEEHDTTAPELPEIDFGAVLRKRIAEGSNELIQSVGLDGERFVLETEKAKLSNKGCNDLAARVELVAETRLGCGFDVLSFHPDGSEIHIEVKSTLSPESSGREFYLTENERSVAEHDPAWTLYRVWEVQSQPHLADMGNIVTNPLEVWIMQPESYRVWKAEC